MRITSSEYSVNCLFVIKRSDVNSEGGSEKRSLLLPRQENIIAEHNIFHLCLFQFSRMVGVDLKSLNGISIWRLFEERGSAAAAAAVNEVK